MKRALALGVGADATCANSVGIFLRAIAEDTLQGLAAGAARIEVIPFWRVVDERSPLASRLSCGAEFVRLARAREARPPASGPSPERSA